MSADDFGEIVLVGAGHAHLYLASRAAAFRARGLRLTLVDPDAFWYSGLATGVLGGRYPPDLDRVDPRPLIESGGGRFVRDRVVGLDRERREARLAGGDALPYDMISFNVGSEVIAPPSLDRAGCTWTAKPVRRLIELRAHLEAMFRASLPAARTTRRAVVIGGGTSGCEIAANLDALARLNGVTLHITLVTADARLLAEHRPRVAHRLHRALRGRGIEIVTDTEATAAAEHGCVTSAGARYEADVVVLATGLRPPRWLADLGLDLGPNGGLSVDASLRSVSDRRVFGAGDCIELSGRPLPMLGVHAVRQAPVLYDNLLADCMETSLRLFAPQKRCLSILDLGLGRGLALWGPLHWLGPGAMWLKGRIDRRFLDIYRG